MAPRILLGLCVCLYLLLDTAPIRTRGLPGDNSDCVDIQRSRALGLIMAGGMVLLERDQGVHDPLFVAPVHIREYLLAKVVSVGVIPCGRMGDSYGDRQSPGISACFFCWYCLNINLHDLVSIGVAARQRTVNSFILMVQVRAPFILPLFSFLQLWHEDLFLVLPTEGTLRLIVSPSDGLSIGAYYIPYVFC